MRAKKSLGQNFLKSEAALQKIIGAGEIGPDDTILEIGPGKGALTERLLIHAGKVIAVEKDRELVEFLQNKFKEEVSAGKLVLINEDILNFTAKQKYKIIANIPYNITGAILKKFLTSENQPERMVLMVQHEVAQRIIARDGKESILSISVKAYGHPKILMKVPARYFSPAPKVDSAIIAITDISREFFERKNVAEEKFWEIVKKGFAHKRKKLSSNLRELVPLEKTTTLPKNARAEDLKLEDWLNFI
ncbi:MAG: 16S rRNA (adenine(1518)-N(6)/adenine(1519)-N(6))-dimethyltransferase RsmA [bacterium]|nr:16S rRNA (adenine(1518)-N(6)/adenine(1519)-N(6))-dimethyltransferase RsmA [bacterium]